MLRKELMKQAWSLYVDGMKMMLKHWGNHRMPGFVPVDKERQV